jgi:hypothetical protein
VPLRHWLVLQLRLQDDRRPDLHEVRLPLRRQYGADDGFSFLFFSFFLSEELFCFISTSHSTAPYDKPSVLVTFLATLLFPCYLVLSLLYTSLCCPCTTAFISFLCYLKWFDEDESELELFGCAGCWCICCFPLIFYKRFCLCCYTPTDELLARNTKAGEKKEERRVKKFDKKERKEVEKKKKADAKAIKDAAEEI